MPTKAGLLFLALLSISGAASAAPDLSLVWSRTFSSPGNNADEALAIAVNPSGSILVAGYETGSTKADWLMVRLDQAGETVWTRTFDGTCHGGDTAYGAAFDQYGNWLVAGVSNTLFEQDNWQALILGPAGDGVGSTTWDSPASAADVARAVCAIPGGDYAMVGNESRADLLEGLNWRVRRYHADGSLAWTATLNGSASGNDEATAVAVDSSGNLYVAGYEDSGGGTGGFDARLVKYSPAGEEVWRRTASHLGPAIEIDEYFSAVAVDSSGNIFVAGRQASTGEGLTDWRVIKYGSDGTELWTTKYDNPSPAVCPGWYTPLPYGNDRATAVAVDPRGNVIVAGGENFNPECIDGGLPTNNWSMLLRVWSPSGALLSSTSYSNGSTMYDDEMANAVAADAFGNIYVAGYQVEAAALGGRNAFVRMYSRPGWPARPVEVVVTPATPVESDADLEGAWLQSNYFRPSRGEQLVIKAKPVDGTPIRVSVYTASGRLVDEIIRFQADSLGRLVAVWDGLDADGRRATRGVYLVRVDGGGVGRTMKVLVK